MTDAARPVQLPVSGGARFLTAAGRAFRRKCPYCAGGRIFDDFISLKKRCPNCNTLYAYEDGYFLGAYAVNVIAMIFLGIALVFGLIALTDLSVLQMQILGVGIVVVLPILFYPLSLLIWIAIDLTLHPPGDLSGRDRQ
jgi:uncharacterized protein (DUF983 family)